MHMCVALQLHSRPCTGGSDAVMLCMLAQAMVDTQIPTG